MKGSIAMPTNLSKNYRLHALMHRRTGVDSLLLMRNVGYGGSAACLVILLALIPAGPREAGLMVSLLSTSISLPFWLLIGIVYEYYIFLGERSYPHLRTGLFVGVVGFSMAMAGLGMIAAVSGILWFLLPEAAYAFGASCLLALLLIGCFQHHITAWWFRDGGPGGKEDHEDA
jgi:hypothetical protein